MLSGGWRPDGRLGCRLNRRVVGRLDARTVCRLGRRSARQPDGRVVCRLDGRMVWRLGGRLNRRDWLARVARRAWSLPGWHSGRSSGRRLLDRRRRGRQHAVKVDLGWPPARRLLLDMRWMLRRPVMPRAGPVAPAAAAAAAVAMATAACTGASGGASRAAALAVATPSTTAAAGRRWSTSAASPLGGATVNSAWAAGPASAPPPAPAAWSRHRPDRTHPPPTGCRASTRASSRPPP